LAFESKKGSQGDSLTQEHLICSTRERAESLDIQRLDGRAWPVLYGQTNSDRAENNSDQEEGHH
jgi:hypothetical protein